MSAEGHRCRQRDFEFKLANKPLTNDQEAGPDDSEPAFDLAILVGDTGLEPVTSSVSAGPCRAGTSTVHNSGPAGTDHGAESGRRSVSTRRPMRAEEMVAMEYLVTRRGPAADAG
jgi:hypothetical protein